MQREFETGDAVVAGQLRKKGWSEMLGLLAEFAKADAELARNKQRDGAVAVQFDVLGNMLAAMSVDQQAKGN